MGESAERPSDCTDTAKSGDLCKDLLGGSAGTPALLWSVPFCGTLAAGCYFLKARDLDRGNGILLAAVLLSFMVLHDDYAHVLWLTFANAAASTCQLGNVTAV